VDVAVEDWQAMSPAAAMIGSEPGLGEGLGLELEDGLGEGDWHFLAGWQFGLLDARANGVAESRTRKTVARTGGTVRTITTTIDAATAAARISFL
jgi:hypothetical protein